MSNLCFLNNCIADRCIQLGAGMLVPVNIYFNLKIIKVRVEKAGWGRGRQET